MGSSRSTARRGRRGLYALMRATAEGIGRCVPITLPGSGPGPGDIRGGGSAFLRRRDGRFSQECGI